MKKSKSPEKKIPFPRANDKKQKESTQTLEKDKNFTDGTRNIQSNSHKQELTFPSVSQKILVKKQHSDLSTMSLQSKQKLNTPHLQRTEPLPTPKRRTSIFPNIIVANPYYTMTKKNGPTSLRSPNIVVPNLLYYEVNTKKENASQQSQQTSTQSKIREKSNELKSKVDEQPESSRKVTGAIRETEEILKTVVRNNKKD